MRFSKMHGLGNDYVYVNCLMEKVENPEAVARYVSDRHFGIGSDGLILIKPCDVADFEMDMYNADGSRGKMCGNGIRCVGKYVYDYGLTNKEEISISTLSGIKYLKLTVVDGKVEKVRVNMGKPVLKPELIPVRVLNSNSPWNRTEGSKSDNQKVESIINYPVKVGGEKYYMTCVSMGNPHAVVSVDNVDELDIEKIGPIWENSEMFPERVNTEFIQVIDRNNVRMRVWERGSGETMACGTGACAVAVSCILNGYTERKVTIHLLGGDLDIEWDENDENIYMNGPATLVFEGEIMV